MADTEDLKSSELKTHGGSSPSAPNKQPEFSIVYICPHCKAVVDILIEREGHYC